MAIAVAPLTCSMTLSEVRTVAVNFAPKLDSGAKLTGTPTIVEVTTSTLTLANKSVLSGIAVSGATWDEDLLKLTKTSGFLNYHHNQGDTIQITGGTGATAGTYYVASRLSDNEIILETSIGVAADGQTNIAGTLNGARMILGKPCYPGQGVTFKVTPSAAGTYTVRITCATDETPAQTLALDVNIEVGAAGS